MRNLYSRLRLLDPKPGQKKIPLDCYNYLTMCPEVYASPKQKTSMVGDILVTNFFCHFRVLKEPHSNQGQNSEALILQEVLWYSRVCKTTSLHLQPHENVERYVKRGWNS
jgi:hypothetical protein